VTLSQFSLRFECPPVYSRPSRLSRFAFTFFQQRHRTRPGLPSPSLLLPPRPRHENGLSRLHPLIVFIPSRYSERPCPPFLALLDVFKLLRLSFLICDALKTRQSVSRFWLSFFSLFGLIRPSSLTGPPSHFFPSCLGLFAAEVVRQREVEGTPFTSLLPLLFHLRSSFFFPNPFRFLWGGRP